MAAAMFFLLAGAQYIMVSEAFACKPCFSTHFSVIRPFDRGCRFHGPSKHQFSPTPQVLTTPTIASTSKPSQCREAIGTPQYITITANVTDESYLYNADLLMLSACLFYASEMSEKGFKVIFGNVSGVVSACVNFTDYVAHVTQHTQQYHLVVDHVRLLHFLTPSAMRWATTIACLFAILLAI
nr:GP4 [Porcine reproductive and respiratory syndrome virus]